MTALALHEKPNIKELSLLPDPRKHCHICGFCMKGTFNFSSFKPNYLIDIQELPKS